MKDMNDDEHYINIIHSKQCDVLLSTSTRTKLVEETHPLSRQLETAPPQ